MTSKPPIDMAPSTHTGLDGPYVQMRETHSGVVFLVGDRVYKLKKAVDLGFLDFSTRERRLRVCQQEVQLNRRFSPDVYLGVADIIGPEGEPEDHMVVMRRMPEDRRLSTLVRSGADVEAPVRALARAMAVFHASASRSDEISDEGSRDAVRDRWRASFDQTRPFVGDVLPQETADEIERLTLAYLDGRADLFGQRVASQAIVDGHGDLMADDIFCLPDGPRILDCLEFDDTLRYVDTIDDICFLVMDLERLGNPLLGERFLAWYLDFSGDHVPKSLIHHYIAYRAFVRAKVSCIRHEQGDLGAADEARSLAEIAHRHLSQAAVALVLVGGAPGTGKSTLAGGLADQLSMSILSSDRVRKEIAGISPHSSAAAPLQEGLYAPDQTQRTYDELMSRAGQLLRMGESVIIDATWSDPTHRLLAQDLAKKCSAEITQIRCALPLEKAADRITRRRHNPSDADPAIAAALAHSFPDWPAASVIDTTEPADACVNRAAQIVRPGIVTTGPFNGPEAMPDLS